MIKFENNMIRGTVSDRPRDCEYRISIRVPYSVLADDDSVADVASSFAEVLEYVRECAGIAEAAEALKALKEQENNSPNNNSQKI